MKKFISLIAIVILTSSCSVIKGFREPALDVDHLKRGEKIDIRSFLDGKLEGFAIVQDKDGNIISTKKLTIKGEWEDNKGVIKYTYLMEDGKKDTRTWLISMSENGESFTGVGHDIVSPAKGKQVGNAMQMLYTLLLDKNGKKSEVDFNDKIYLVDSESAIMIVDLKEGFSSSGKSIISLKKENNDCSVRKSVSAPAPKADKENE